jgi:hypothetical protein
LQLATQAAKDHWTFVAMPIILSCAAACRYAACRYAACRATACFTTRAVSSATHSFEGRFASQCCKDNK